MTGEWVCASVVPEKYPITCMTLLKKTIVPHIIMDGHGHFACHLFNLWQSDEDEDIIIDCTLLLVPEKINGSSSCTGQSISLWGIKFSALALYPSLRLLVNVGWGNAGLGEGVSLACGCQLPALDRA